MHASVMLAALRAGKHVYGQKPLTRTVTEARAVAHAARSSGAVTQMGIQNHSNKPYSAALELFRAGHIGRVYEVHVWTDRPAGWWPQGVTRPRARTGAATLAWDLWLGVAPVSLQEGPLPPSRPARRRLGLAPRRPGCHPMDPALVPRASGTRSIPLRGPRRRKPPVRASLHVPSNRPTMPAAAGDPHDGGKSPKQELRSPPPASTRTRARSSASTARARESPSRRACSRPSSRRSGPRGLSVNHWHQWVGRVQRRAPLRVRRLPDESRCSATWPCTSARDARLGPEARATDRPEADRYLPPRRAG
jgi:hypothetical protein